MFNNVENFLNSIVSVRGPCREVVERDPARRAARKVLASIPKAQCDEQMRQAWAVADRFYGASQIPHDERPRMASALGGKGSFAPDTSAAGMQLVRIAATLRPTHSIASETLVQRVRSEEGERFCNVIDTVELLSTRSAASSGVGPVLLGLQLGLVADIALLFIGSIDGQNWRTLVAPGLGVLSGLALGALKISHTWTEQGALRAFAADLDGVADAV